MNKNNLKILTRGYLVPLNDPNVYFARRYDENMRDGNMECGGLRQSGRTTRMILRVLEEYEEKPWINYFILAGDEGVREVIREMVNHFTGQLGSSFPRLDNLKIITEDETYLIPSGSHESVRAYTDNSITDMRLVKKP